MTRSEIHAEFVARFCKGGGPEPEALMRSAEEHLGIFLPRSCVDFISKYGAVDSRPLLGLIVDSGADIRDLQVFFPVGELVQANEGYWSGGMRCYLIGFAMDCMGNFFCFDRRDLSIARRDDAPIWFFDHDFCSDEKIFDSFDSWLAAYSLLDRDPGE